MKLMIFKIIIPLFPLTLVLNQSYCQQPETIYDCLLKDIDEIARRINEAEETNSGGVSLSDLDMSGLYVNGGHFLPHLLKHTQHQSLRVRRYFYRKIADIDEREDGIINNEIILEYLLLGLNDKDVQKTCASHLLYVKDEMISKIDPYLFLEISPVLTSGIYLIGLMEKKELIEPLQYFKQKYDPTIYPKTIHNAIVAALAKLGDQNSIEVIRTMLHSDNPSRQTDAIYMAAYTKNKELILEFVDITQTVRNTINLYTFKEWEQKAKENREQTLKEYQEFENVAPILYESYCVLNEIKSGKVVVTKNHMKSRLHFPTSTEIDQILTWATEYFNQ